MGAFLPTPKTEKQFDSGEKNGLKYALVAMQGWRVEMEDAHTISIDDLGKDTCLFAVFDGHAGSKVAKKASTELLAQLKQLNKEEDFGKKMKKGFRKLDEELRSLNDRSGSTALVCTITPTQIIFSNCGDSRGFLCSYKDDEDKDNEDKDGKVKNIIKFSTEDHKPYNDKEQARIENAGGTVMMQRVNGSLAVSRALGDFDYKSAPGLDAFEQMVSPEPETEIIERSEDDKFVLLACDGVYDVMANEDIADFILGRLKTGMDIKKICSQLIDICLHKVILTSGWQSLLKEVEL